MHWLHAVLTMSKQNPFFVSLTVGKEKYIKCCTAAVDSETGRTTEHIRHPYFKRMVFPNRLLLIIVDISIFEHSHVGSDTLAISAPCLVHAVVTQI